MKMETRNDSKLMDLFFEFYNGNKRRKYKKENAQLTADPIVFFGDSITDFCDLAKWYPGVNAVNRGISGNTTTDLLNRIDLSVCEAHPSKIILLIGINDMMNVKRSAKETAEKYEELVRQLKLRCPSVPLYVQSVYPGCDVPKNDENKGMIFPIAHLAPAILELNGYIQELCEKYGCTYIDVHSHLKLEDDTMNPAYTKDGCHPNDAGYQVISGVVKEYL